MKILMIGLIVFSCATTAWGARFQMDRKGDAIVDVEQSSGEYRVTCTFKPQTKFDQAVNAKLNDTKGDSLCKKGLARYLKVSENETLAVAGLYSVTPVETVGEKLRYSFGVPISGCKILKAEVKPKQALAPAKPTPLALSTPQAATNVMQKKEIKAVAPKEPPQPKTAKVVISSSYLCVARYREINGERMTISHQEYQGHNFKSPREFDRFCQQEFARIRALGDANLLAVRKLWKR